VSKDRRKIKGHHATLQPIGAQPDDHEKTVRINVGKQPTHLKRRMVS